MTEPSAPELIAVVWSTEARVDLCAIDRETAMQILHCMDRYLASRIGDVKKLKTPLTGFRLRCGDYRVFFDLKDENTIQITTVRHRAKHTGELSAILRGVPLLEKREKWGTRLVSAPLPYYRHLSRQADRCRNRESTTRITTLAVGYGCEARGIPFIAKNAMSGAPA